MSNDFRAYLTLTSDNQGTKEPVYKLASGQVIFGFVNCKILNLDFERGEYEGNLLFQPIDKEKPIILACRHVTSDCNFFVLDSHLTKEKEKGMINFKPFESGQYQILCSTFQIKDKIIVLCIEESQ